MKGKKINSSVQSRKDFNAALTHFLKECVPVLSKDLLCKPVVNKIIELVDHYMPKTERMRPGQVLWYAVDKKETAGYGKKIEDCQIVPVMLDLISEEDIEDIMNKLPKRKRQEKVAVRLHNQAYQQGGVLTYADTAAIMRLSPGTVGKYIREYEKEHNIPVPRRGNIHDMGPTLTHKKIICVKHLMEGKTIETTARETNHSTSAVTRYINDFKRVYICLNSGWEYGKITQATGMSQSLVKEYVDLIESNGNLNSNNINGNLLDAKK